MRILIAAMLALVASGAAAPARADNLPSRTIRLIVPFWPGAVALPQVRAGNIKALAELSPKRSPSMPDIPSADESGVSGLYIKAAGIRGQ